MIKMNAIDWSKMVEEDMNYFNKTFCDQFYEDIKRQSLAKIDQLKPEEGNNKQEKK